VPPVAEATSDLGYIRFRVVVDKIMRENDLTDSIVRPGQVLKVAIPLAYTP
jgi:hypothetical protein